MYRIQNVNNKFGYIFIDIYIKMYIIIVCLQIAKKNK